MLASSKILVAVAAIATVFPAVVAHGTVGTLKVKGETFTGPPISITGQHPHSAVRQVSDVSPVKDPNGPDLLCGFNAAKSATDTITVSAGDTLTIQWKSGLGPEWPHIYGPIMTYMASCSDSTTCGGPDLEFFKIQQKGQTSPGENKWFQQNIHDGQPTTVTIPANIPAGDYLMRHEIIALHNAMTPGGVEFYPQCIQLKVTGGGNSKPPANLLTTFPGAYKAADPGLLIDLYNGRFNYDFPGPQVFGAGGSSTPANVAPKPNPPSNGKPSTVSPASTTKAPSSSPTQPPSSKPKPAKKCPVKKRSNARRMTASTPNTTSHRRNMDHHRRVVSRMMPRRLGQRDLDHSAPQ